jgi:hypothetical protein
MYTDLSLRLGSSETDDDYLSMDELLKEQGDSLSKYYRNSLSFSSDFGSQYTDRPRRSLKRKSSKRAKRKSSKRNKSKPQRKSSKHAKRKSSKRAKRNSSKHAKHKSSKRTKRKSSKRANASFQINKHELLS